MVHRTSYKLSNRYIVTRKGLERTRIVSFTENFSNFSISLCAHWLNSKMLVSFYQRQASRKDGSFEGHSPGCIEYVYTAWW